MGAVVWESIMNFEVGQLVKFNSQWYRIKKIKDNRILILFNKKLVYFHCSHFKSKPPQLYKEWHGEELKVLRSGIRPKEMSKKLSRNIGSIYNKMHRLGIPVKTDKKSMTEIYNELKIKKPR